MKISRRFTRQVLKETVVLEKKEFDVRKGAFELRFESSVK